ncbi:MAG: hypothetical protein J6Q69_07150 [Clostridia bacterium]|nr:hypothetical protein [Clostridia bacterium]
MLKTSIFLLLIAAFLFLIQPIEVVIKKKDIVSVRLEILVFSIALNTQKRKKASALKMVRSTRLLFYLLRYTDVRVDRLVRRNAGDDPYDLFLKNAYQSAALYPILSALDAYANTLTVSDGAMAPPDKDDIPTVDVTLSSRPYLLLFSMFIFLMGRIKRRLGIGKGYERIDNGKH